MQLCVVVCCVASSSSCQQTVVSVSPYNVSMYHAVLPLCFSHCCRVIIGSPVASVYVKCCSCWMLLFITSLPREPFQCHPSRIQLGSIHTDSSACLSYSLIRDLLKHTGPAANIHKTTRLMSIMQHYVMVIWRVGPEYSAIWLKKMHT